MSKVWTYDPEKTKNVKYATGSLNPKKGHYCSVGKLAKGCGIKIFNSTRVKDLDFTAIFNKHIGPSWAYVNNDKPIERAKTESAKEKAYNKAFDSLLKICVKVGFVKIKGVKQKMTNVANKLKKARAKKGFTLQQVAAKAKTSSGYVHDMENGRRQPSEAMLKRLSKVLFT